MEQELTHTPANIETAPEAEAQRIVIASDDQVQDFVRRGVMQRWLRASFTA